LGQKVINFIGFIGDRSELLLMTLALVA